MKRIALFLALVAGWAALAWVRTATTAGEPFSGVASVALLIAALYVLAAIASRSLPQRVRSAGVLLLLACALTALDPYSTGNTGGDSRIHPTHTWQIYVAAASVGVLLLALGSLASGKTTAYGILVVLEMIVFVTTNWIYISRDGIEVRGFAGYWASPQPVMAVVVGVVIRIVLLLLLLREVFVSPKTGAEAR